MIEQQVCHPSFAWFDDHQKERRRWIRICVNDLLWSCLKTSIYEKSYLNVNVKVFFRSKSLIFSCCYALTCICHHTSALLNYCKFQYVSLCFSVFCKSVNVFCLFNSEEKNVMTISSNLFSQWMLYMYVCVVFVCL